MNPEMTEGVGTDTAKKQVDVSVEEPGTLAKLSAAGGRGQWQQVLRQVKVDAILAEVPKYVSEFFKEHRQSIITITLILTAIITVKVTLAVLDALNDLPLLAPTFELIGIGYTAWFAWRYLLRASNREELLQEINSLKNQVLGAGK